MMPGTRNYDVAVVGGGLVGAAIAWGLARVGRSVAVLDEGDVAYRASRGNFALVWVQSKGLGMPEYAAWTKRSSDTWSGFAETLRDETGLDVCFRRPGGFHLCLSERELEHRANLLRRLHNQYAMVKYDYAMLDRKQIEAAFPQIGPEVVGASYCALDGHVNSLRLMRALHIAMQRMGAVYLADHRVERIDQRGDAFRLTTHNGEVQAQKLVLAAGNGNARLGPMVGLNVPVHPQRGHIIVTEKVEPFLDHPITTIRQTDEGGILIGDSVEEVGFDTNVNTRVVSAMAERAIRMFPLLGRLNVVRSWAALRVMTPDGFPIYDQSASCPGAFVAACHSGVTLAANHALALAPHIARGELPAAELGIFGARRFSVPPVA
jgi:glycine/D-amino acid oxidase-like deaminating enzyme